MSNLHTFGRIDNNIQIEELGKTFFSSSLTMIRHYVCVLKSKKISKFYIN